MSLLQVTGYNDDATDLITAFYIKLGLMELAVQYLQRHYSHLYALCFTSTIKYKE